MKRFAIRLLILGAILVLADLAAGQVFPRLVAMAKGGDNWRNNYICDQASDDILIFGSSRAIHHYNPVIISDSLGLSCYNCGQNGNGIILNWGRYEMIHQRHTPRYIIYDIMPSFDILAGEDNAKYLKWLRPYYDREGIPGIFESVDKRERIKMMSNLYRYNSSFVQIVSDCIHPMQFSGIQGFRPLAGEMDTLKVSKKSRPAANPEYDPLKLHYWDKFLGAGTEERGTFDSGDSGSVSESGVLGESGTPGESSVPAVSPETKVILVLSPAWDKFSEESYRPIKDRADSLGIPLLDFSADPKYNHNPLYFKDGGHLNSRGADEFTRDLVGALRGM